MYPKLIWFKNEIELYEIMAKRHISNSDIKSFIYSDINGHGMWYIPSL